MMETRSAMDAKVNCTLAKPAAWCQKEHAIERGTSVAEQQRNSRDVELDHELILQAWNCILGESRITYLSGPITTGPRWVASVEKGLGQAERLENLARNLADIQNAARVLRAEQSRLVIEPASLNVSRWSQADYLILWTTVIERHAAEVVFMPGWNYSIGCALEFERAVLHQIPTRMLNGSKLDYSEAIAAISAAASHLAPLDRRDTALSNLGLRLRDVAERVERDAKQAAIS